MAVRLNTGIDDSAHSPAAPPWQGIRGWLWLFLLHDRILHTTAGAGAINCSFVWTRPRFDALLNLLLHDPLTDLPVQRQRIKRLTPFERIQPEIQRNKFKVIGGQHRNKRAP